MIIITHLHADHYADLPALLLNLEVEKKLKPIYLVGPKELKNKLIELCHIYYQDFLDEFIKKRLKFMGFLTYFDNWSRNPKDYICKLEIINEDEYLKDFLIRKEYINKGEENE